MRTVSPVAASEDEDVGALSGDVERVVVVVRVVKHGPHLRRTQDERDIAAIGADDGVAGRPPREEVVSNVLGRAAVVVEPVDDGRLDLTRPQHRAVCAAVPGDDGAVRPRPVLSAALRLLLLRQLWGGDVEEVLADGCGVVVSAGGSLRDALLDLRGAQGGGLHLRQLRGARAAGAQGFREQDSRSQGRADEAPATEVRACAGHDEAPEMPKMRKEWEPLSGPVAMMTRVVPGVLRVVSSGFDDGDGSSMVHTCRVPGG